MNALASNDPSPATSKAPEKNVLAPEKNRLLNVYEKALRGFSAMVTSKAAEYIEQQPEVEYVVEDVGGAATAVQSPVPAWDVDRVDQRSLPLDSTYEYNFDGTAVHAYVFDSGIRSTHVEFVRRVGNGYDAQDQDTTPTDCYGHGTHVSGILGGTDYCVAKDVTIHPIRVLDCDGIFSSSSIVSDGIEWVLENLQMPAVAHFSLSTFEPYAPLDQAVANLVDAGVTTAVSAGNNAGSNLADPVCIVPNGN